MPHRLAGILVGLMLAALAGAPSRGAPATNPRLASLQIEIWPEHDRPQALVILKGELSPDAALPAVIALRIPASSGGPSAVAYADTSGKLLNLSYEREDAGGLVTLRLRTPQRTFHVEFYDALALGKSAREYRYAWLGDMAVDRLAVLVREPVAASNLSVQPGLGTASAGGDGFNYRAADLGALKLGQALPIEIRYTKTDPRTSLEILAASQPGSARRDAPGVGWLLGLGAAALALAAGAAVLWRRRRMKPSGRFCAKCGAATSSGGRFCANCGAALR